MPIEGPNQKFSYAQLEALWIQAGGQKDLAPTMAAIALAESGGNSGDHNGNAATGDDSYGLWQINYYGANRAPRTARWGPPQNMYNPLANARAAVDLAQGGKGLHNWTTYSSGAFMKYLSPNQAGVGSGIIHVIGGIIHAGGQVQTPAGKISQDFPGASSVTGAATSFWHGIQDIPYALAIIGSLLLALLGIALVGADIGIEQLNAPKPVKAVRSRIPSRSSESSTSDEYELGVRQGEREAARREGRKVGRSRIASRERIDTRPKPVYSTRAKKKDDEIPY